MKGKRRHLLFATFVLSTVGGMLLSGNDSKAFVPAKAPLLASQVNEEDGQYLGYGYDVTSGKAISDPGALSLANPILDVDNPDLMKYARMFTSSVTQYQSFSSSLVSKVAENYGTTLSGGVGGKIYAVSLNVSTKFNTSVSWEKTAAEEYSYYSIYAKNRTVLFQTTPEVLSGYLHPTFLKAVQGIDSVEDADNVFKKYGTHLVTGYDLGGIFEMTNYYATCSYTYQKQNQFAFDTQVNAAFGAYAASTNFSFSQEYGMLDNNSYATNNYKCTTYGGYVFPGLTIDQAFSYYETAFGAGYIYGLWTDSINAGKNLSIISVPASSEMVPLWSLLPSTSNYDRARMYLINSYIKQCSLSYREFLEKYPDVNSTVAPVDADPEEIGYAGLGYEYYHKTNAGKLDSYYISSDSYSNSIEVSTDSIVAFDFASSLYTSRKLQWCLTNDSVATVLDERNGVIRFDDVGNTEIILKLDGVQIYYVDVSIKYGKYSGGLGTKAEPYLLSTEQDIINFTNNSDEWHNLIYYKMTNDITIQPSNQENLGVIGPIPSKAFSGIFDGGGYTLYDFSLDYYSHVGDYYSQNGAIGLFGYNQGSIKNLTLDCSNFSPDDRGNCIKNYAISIDANDGKDRQAKYFGGLVGYNEGEIYNCTVNNMVLSITTADKNEDVNVGIIAGYNSNTTKTKINMCRVDMCEINLLSRYKTSINVGGVIGKNFNSVSRLECRDLLVKVREIDAGSNSVIVSIGNIIGTNESNDKAISDCLAFNRSADDTDDGRKIYIYNNYSSINTSDYFFAGGIIGSEVSTSKSSTYSRLVSYNIVSMKDDKGYIKAGALLGRVITGAKTPTFTDCYYRRHSYNCRGDSTSEPSGVNSEYGALLLESVVCPDGIRESENWEENSSGAPSLVFDPITSYTVNFNLEKVKKTFLLGESFKAGEIVVNATDYMGDDVDVDRVTIDNSRFDSSKEGTYYIYVSALNKTVSYSVRVVKADIYRIKVVQDPVSVDYYEGDIFNPANMKIAVVYENGDDSFVLNATNESIEITNIDTPLMAGVNLMNIKYTDDYGEEYETVYPVTAKRSIVERVAVTSNVEFRAPVGTTKLSPADLEGLTLDVALEKQDGSVNPKEYTVSFTKEALKKNKVLKTIGGHSYEIDSKEVEFIFSTIKIGNNDVKVCVSGYCESDESTLVIKGYIKDQSSEFNRFTQLITDLYDRTITNGEYVKLNERYSIISEALILKTALNSLENNQEYKDLCVKLDMLTSIYNSQVLAIDNNFANSVIVTQAFNYRSLVGGGLIALPLIAAVFFILF